jgi:AcrR family transcriptional regulator
MNAKKYLIEAMMTLLEKHKIEKITIDMIVKESGVSRATLYRYFPDKYTLMTGCFVHFVDSIPESKSCDVSGNTESCLEFILQNRFYFSNVVKHEGQDSFFSVFCKTADNFMKEKAGKKKDAELDEQELNAISFYTAGASFCIVRWIQGGMISSPKKEAQMIYDNLPEILSPYFY